MKVLLALVIIFSSFNSSASCYYEGTKYHRGMVIKGYICSLHDRWTYHSPNPVIVKNTAINCKENIDGRLSDCNDGKTYIEATQLADTLLEKVSIDSREIAKDSDKGSTKRPERSGEVNPE
jgi:hypothetical protein